MTRLLPLLFLLMVPAVATTQELQLPSNAVATVQEASTPETLIIATGPWQNGALDSLSAEGTVTRNAWRITSGGLTTMQVLQPLRDQLIAQGYEPVFSCKDATCGGFDFRFAIEVLPPPHMQVNLGNFRYWTGVKTSAAGPDHIALLISQIAGAAYIQIDRVNPGGDTGRISTRTAPAPTETATATDLTTSTQPVTDVGVGLSGIGRAVLGDLGFAPGSSELADGTYASLAALADVLKADPALTVALVGHTDSAGSLAGNIALSKRRARAVRARLIAAYGIPARQLEAEGMGYLAPIANNRTETGRDANRRVEVIVTSTE